MYGIIYSAMAPDARIYVGQTIQNFEKRRWQHLSQARRLTKKDYFHRALAKYGAHLFIWKIEKECETKEELDQAEDFYIKHYNSVDKECGFNLKDGGANGSHTAETKKKLSEAQKGQKNHFYGKTHSPETIAIIKAKRANQVMKKGWKMSAEQKLKISNTKRNK